MFIFLILLISPCGVFSLITESVLMLFLYQLASRNKEIKRKCVGHLKEYEEYAEMHVSEYCLLGCLQKREFLMYILIHIF